MDNVQCPSSVILDLLSEMTVQQSSKTVTVKDILQTPPTVPTQPVERQVAEKVVRRMMEERMMKERMMEEEMMEVLMVRFFMSLNKTLSTLHVERQAYHGETFMGNHVHMLVQVFIQN